MKTLLECQDEVARKKHPDYTFNELLWLIGRKAIVEICNEAAEVYAERYARQKCEEQKKLCVEEFKKSFVYINAQVDAIIKAPNACDNK